MVERSRRKLLQQGEFVKQGKVKLTGFIVTCRSLVPQISDISIDPYNREEKILKQTQQNFVEDDDDSTVASITLRTDEDTDSIEELDGRGVNSSSLCDDLPLFTQLSSRPSFRESLRIPRSSSKLGKCMRFADASRPWRRNPSLGTSSSAVEGHRNPEIAMPSSHHHGSDVSGGVSEAVRRPSHDRCPQKPTRRISLESIDR